MGCRLWGRTESDTTEATEQQQQQQCVSCVSPYLSLSSNEICTSSVANCGTSLVAQTVKNLPTVQENWIQALGQEVPLRREWQPTLAFLPRESHGQRNLLGYSPWDQKELDITE